MFRSEDWSTEPVYSIFMKTNSALKRSVVLFSATLLISSPLAYSDIPDRALSSLDGIYKTAASTIPFFGPIREKNGSSTSAAA